MVDLANYTSPLNTALLVIILLCTALVIATIMIILNTLINGISTMVHEVQTIGHQLETKVPSKKFPIIVYNHYLPNGLPNAPFDHLLAGFLSRILMSCTNDSLTEESFLPKEVTIINRWSNTYLLQLPKVLILVFLEIPFDFNSFQSAYTDLQDRICGEARVARTWNHIYNELKHPIYQTLSLLTNPIIITGYGTGAPIAGLMATALGLMGLPICYYGLGSPRIGNNYFYEYMATYVINRWDICNVMDHRIHMPNVPDFSYSNHLYNINVNSNVNSSNSLQTYLCGLDSETCTTDVRWNTPMYSGNN
jgi:hypothetical protein